MDKKEVFVPVICSEASHCVSLKEICAGLEEEGVPYKVVDTIQEWSTSLQIKIVIDGEDILLYHDKLPNKQAYLNEKRGHERRAGKNAARMVKGLPLVSRE
ncbi:glycerol dehydratase reactivase beta/small subunit family protein [Fictibacillus sp. WQ 8-8]|uniref:glycerol dehydratase reactivase beta/small subunit family protein n=1 Tax=Fictibacillus sp. WQ 8-8 TaxID=2938788 RepID=UPI00210A0E69|nr:glycerol dehydratase reactivase beta/small subunit family protein [Fictibacillus sp. WQ 8-8]MCQ6265903.1 glycerol dehydratase reactivase beta/small subunit family protein [Fictibacillus sp. WQ 8-8]